MGEEYRFEVRSRLDVDPPPPQLAKVLAKDETIVFDDKVQLYIGRVAVPSLGSESWMTILSESPLKLILHYRMFPDFLDSDRGGAFGRALRTRWERFGLLRLEGLSTLPIELDLERPPKRVEIDPKRVPGNSH